MNTSECVCCRRPLRNPASVANGLGPVCRGKAKHRDGSSLFGDTPVLNGVGGLLDSGLVCVRLASGELACNVPHDVVHHSPTGFECGYSGSGPAELALNVLHALLPERGAASWWVNGVPVSRDAQRLHQEFKDRFIATMPKDGGRVAIEDINAWIAERLIREAA